MLGNRFSFRTRSGDLGLPWGSMTTGKIRWNFYMAGKFTIFNKGICTKKGVFFLVGESSPPNLDFMILGWWFCCYPDWVFPWDEFLTIVALPKFGVFLFFGVTFSFSVFWPANHQVLKRSGGEDASSSSAKWTHPAYLKILPRSFPHATRVDPGSWIGKYDYNYDKLGVFFPDVRNI